MNDMDQAPAAPAKGFEDSPLAMSLAGLPLRRHPDVEGPNLFAWDAADRYALAEAEPWLAATAPGETVIVDDAYGALTLACRAARPRVFQDSLVGRRALENNAAALGLTAPWPFACHDALDATLFGGAKLVILKLPKALAHLEEIIAAVAAHAHPDVRVIATGMVKHMTPAMNDVIAAAFATTQAGLARQKARVVRAHGLRASAAIAPFPRAWRVPELDLTVHAHGAAFAQGKLDVGTRFLAGFVTAEPGAERIVDLGCGTGVLAALAARANPHATVIASDESAAAVASARATFAANGITNATAAWDDALSALPDARVDVVLCNPPFHRGHAVHAGAALRLFAAAARILRPGGRFLVVYNSHLGYHAPLARLLGPTRVLGKNEKFTVALAQKGA